MRDTLPKPQHLNIEKSPRRISRWSAAAVGLSALLAAGCSGLETKHGTWEIEVACEKEEQQPSVSGVHPNMYVLFSCIDEDGNGQRPESIQIAKQEYDNKVRSYATYAEPNVLVDFTYGGDILPRTPSVWVAEVNSDGEPHEKPGIAIRNAHIGNVVVAEE